MNGITYNNRHEAFQGLSDGKLSHSDWTKVANHFEAQRKSEFVQDNYEFTDAQMATFTAEQIITLHDAMEAHIEIEDLRYSYEDLKSWAENMPYLH